MAAAGVSHTGSYAAVTIGASAAVVKSGKPSRKSILIQNLHATQVLYLGLDSSVTTSNGLRVAAGESVRIDDYNGPVYGIASGAGTDVRYLEVG